MKKTNVLILTFLICFYIVFLDIDFATKIKMLFALSLLTFTSLINNSLYMFIVGISAITLLYTTYDKFNLDLEKIVKTYTDFIGGFNK